MKYGSVKGDATLKGFKDYINLDNFHWEVSRAVVKQPAGRGTTREAKKPDLAPFNVTKGADSASMELLKQICREKKGYKCEISFVRTGEEAAYMTYTFHDALITKITTSTGEGGEQVETIIFDFTAVEAAVYTRNKVNQRGGYIPFDYYNVNDHN